MWGLLQLALHVWCAVERRRSAVGIWCLGAGLAVESQKARRQPHQIFPAARRRLALAGRGLPHNGRAAPLRALRRMFCRPLHLVTRLHPVRLKQRLLLALLQRRAITGQGHNASRGKRARLLQLMPAGAPHWPLLRCASCSSCSSGATLAAAARQEECWNGRRRVGLVHRSCL